MNYATMLFALYEYEIEYHFFIVALSRFHKYMLIEEKNPKTDWEFLIMTDEVEKKIIGKFSGLEFVKTVEEYCKFSEKVNNKKTYNEACQWFYMRSAQSVRAKMINKFIETIYNFDTHNKEKRLVATLKKENWYLMLELLRNVSSHNFHNLTIGWKKYYPPNELVWETIIIKKGMKGNEVRYNDAELFRLFKFGYNYLFSRQNIYGEPESS